MSDRRRSSRVQSLRALTVFKSEAKRKAIQSACRHSVEPLERRMLLDAVLWTGATNNSWEVATNWSPHAPGVADRHHLNRGQSDDHHRLRYTINQQPHLR